MIAVTGANGYIAQATLRFLASNSQPVVAVSRGRPSYQPPDGVIWRDSEGISSLSELFLGCESVIHLAGLAHVRSKKKPEVEFDLANRKYALDIAANAKVAGVKKFIFVSTVGVHGSWSPSVINSDSPISPDTSYALSKAKAETELEIFCLENHMQLCIVRPPMVYGPRCPGNFSRLVRLVKSGLPLPFGAATAVRSFIHVDNLASFLALCAISEFKEIAKVVISDGSDWSTKELVQGISLALGISQKLFNMPEKLIYFLGRPLGLERQLNSLFKPMRIGCEADVNLLNWTPVFDVRSGFGSVV